MALWARDFCNNTLGATVIGTVGSPEKAELARAHGCDHPIEYRTENFVERVREITSGVGVPVVYDSVGKDTFDASLDCLRPRGMMVSFGQSSGSIPPFDPGVLARKGSLFLTRPSLAAYIGTREELEETTADLFDVVLRGAVQIEVKQTYALAEVAKAHRDLEARKTTGSTVLRIGGDSVLAPVSHRTPQGTPHALHPYDVRPHRQGQPRAPDIRPHPPADWPYSRRADPRCLRRRGR